MSSEAATMTPEQADFFHAELKREPEAFISLSISEIEAELDYRWKKRHHAQGGTYVFEEKLSDEEAAANGVVYCGEIVRGATTTHLYKTAKQAGGVSSASSEGKRKREEEATPSSGAASSASSEGKRKREEEPKPSSGAASSSSSGKMIHIETFLVQFKKDTLQRMCDDLDIPVSGTKSDVISRIIMRT